MTAKRQSRFAVPIAFWAGLVAAAAVLWLTGIFNDAWSSLASAQLAVLILVVLVATALPLIHAMRWRLVMSSLGNRLTAAEAADLTVSSALLNYASPGFIGASAKAILANRTNKVPYNHSVVSIAFEHGLDLILLVGGSVIAILLLGASNFSGLFSFGGWLPSPFIGGLITLGILVALYLILRTRLRGWAEQGLTAVKTVGRRVDRTGVALLTFLYWLMQAVVVGLLFWALHIPIQITDILALSTLPLLAGMLAPLPGGIGAREAVIVALAVTTGISAGTLLSLAILQRVLLVASLPLSLLVVRIVKHIGERQ